MFRVCSAPSLPAESTLEVPASTAQIGEREDRPNPNDDRPCSGEKRLQTSRRPWATYRHSLDLESFVHMDVRRLCGVVCGVAFVVALGRSHAGVRAPGEAARLCCTRSERMPTCEAMRRLSLDNQGPPATQLANCVGVNCVGAFRKWIGGRQGPARGPRRRPCRMSHRRGHSRLRFGQKVVPWGDVGEETEFELQAVASSKKDCPGVRALGAEFAADFQTTLAADFGPLQRDPHGSSNVGVYDAIGDALA